MKIDPVIDFLVSARGFFTFSNIADLSSIIGLVITISVLYSVRKLRAHFLFTARMPQLIRQLSGHASSLSAQLRDFENSLHEVDQELARCHANLKNLKSKVTGDAKKSVKALLTRIQNERRQHITVQSKQEVWDIYTELLAVIEEVKNLRKDKKWGSEDGA